MTRRPIPESARSVHANDPTAPMSGRGVTELLEQRPVPVLLVAHAPSGSVTVDRCAVTPGFRVGRGEQASLQVMGPELSREHFRIVAQPSGLAIEDCGSKNGTFLQGERIAGQKALEDGVVVRAGHVVFVFHIDGRRLMVPPPLERHGIHGAFFAGPLIEELREASRSSRHLLLAGPSGTGKERAARALVELAASEQSPLPLLAHNAARYATEDEAASTLFGVGSRVFSQVDDRVGLIEAARGGYLLLDEVHSLPERLQRSLLRVVEDGLSSRIGETRTRPAAVRFIFASNVPGENCGLLPDLRARLRAVRIPALRERVADIPGIFRGVLADVFGAARRDCEPVWAALEAEDVERICLDGFSTDNVRGLVDLADRILSRVTLGVEVKEAVATVMAERFGPSPVTAPDATTEEAASNHYERLKPVILATYQACGGNLSALERELKAQGVRCSWRWLATYLRRWGVRAD